MKSLEYVKKIREDLNQCFRHWNPATMSNDNDFYHKEWETIQQDLEVLEILRKQARFEFNELSAEDYAKLKQWLEENENDR
jgi:hypothetical protein